MIATPLRPHRRPDSPRRNASARVALFLVALALSAAACDSASTAGSARPVQSGSGPVVSAPSSTSAGGSGSAAGDVGGGGGGPLSGPSAAPSGLLDPAPSSAPQGSPGPSAPTVRGAYDPARFGFAAKGLRGEVMAFVTTSQVDDALARLDFASTSTIAYFSLVATANGAISRDTRWRSWNRPAVDELIARAHASGTKVVISLARFSWSPGETAASATLLGSAAARARLAGEVADEVVRRGVDGVNVDFEPIPLGQKANFTDLIRRIRTELDARRPAYQLTFDVVGHFESYDVAAALAPGGADAVYLMGYHYAGTFSTIAHGTAPLGGPRYSVSDAIRGLRAVAKPSQVIVGVPYYGHLWPTRTGALNARTTGRGYDVLYRDARDIGRRRGTTYDPVEKVEQVAWRDRACPTCPVQWFQLYYDDARSLGAKWAEFQRQGLLGTGVWTSAFEGTSGELTAAMRKAWRIGG